eukprot:TRINITY_DN56715_c0_g1_i1.p1 TRINITY_DN56715_c0_g1~~TRINITY_DN56715_c0_g1_i1.p1  ORF type:complete len:602 (+),score=133.16 TRINITY_DN56715_c0_g1_i1:67-1872(+)
MVLSRIVFSFSILVCANAFRWVLNDTFSISAWGPNANSMEVQCNGKSTTMGKSSSTGVWAGNVSVADCPAGSTYQLVVNGNMRRIDPLGLDITSDGSGSVVPKQYTFSNPPFFPAHGKLVVYEMHVQSFTEEGTFDAAAQKIPYLQKLGVSAVELMPTAFFCGGSNEWGYNPCAPWATMPALGGSYGLKRFVDACAGAGIGVIADVVWNHLDSNNRLNNFDGSDAYFYGGNLANTPWGPRPNYDTSYVSGDYIVGQVVNLLEEFHVGGFRWDSTICIRQGGNSGDANCWDKGQPTIAAGWDLLRRANDVLHSKASGRVTPWSVAEDNQGDLSVTRPTSSGGGGFDGQWGYRTYYEVLPQLTNPSNADIDMNAVAQACACSKGEDPRNVFFLENHDVASSQQRGRIPNLIQPGGATGQANYWAQKKSLLGVAFVVACRGWPMLLMGQEYLEFQSFAYPVPPKFNWAVATGAGQGMVAAVADMIRLRSHSDGDAAGMQGGDSTSVQVAHVWSTSTEKVAVMVRRAPGGYAVVVHNWMDQLYSGLVVSGFPADGTWTRLYNGDDQRYSPLFGGGCAGQTSVVVSGGQATLCVPKLAAVVFGQQQ